MKLSKTTTGILKNFSQICQSIYIDGNVLKTKSYPANNLLATAVVEEDFPSFGIFALDEFCNVISNLDPETLDLDFHENYVIIKDSSVSIRYYYCDPQHIYNVVPQELYEKMNSFNEFDASFKLSKQELGKISKFSSVINFGTNRDEEKILNIVLEDGRGCITLQNESNNLMNSFRMEVSGTGNCDAKMKLSNMVFIPTDYDVFVSQKSIKFSAGTLNYFCALMKK